jgi:two-component system sensor histidine kinase/response regulator
MQNVLVIDDAAEVRSVVADTLAHFGFSTRQAADGRTGIEMALAEPPDLILCDVRMPELDGYRTLAAIRDLPAIADIPFVFLTAAVDKCDMRRGMASGADDYLTKPFTPEELLEAVATRLARQTELKCGVYKHAEKLRKDVEHLLAREFTAPLNGILGLTTPLMKDAGLLSPEKVSASARQISETVHRLNRLAASLA